MTFTVLLITAASKMFLGLYRSSSRDLLNRTTFGGLYRSPSTTLSLYKSPQTTSMYRSASATCIAPRNAQCFPIRARSPYTSTPSHLERHPYLRYYIGYAAESPISVLAGHRYLRRDHYSQRDRSQQNYYDSSLRLYASSLEMRPRWGALYSRPGWEARGGPAKVERGEIDNAVKNYNNYKMYGAGDAYWHSSSHWIAKRDEAFKRGLELSRQGLSYYSRYPKS